MLKAFKKLRWAIKRWWVFQTTPCPKIGELLTFYPFNPLDTLRQDVIIYGLRGETIHYKIVGSDKMLTMWAGDFLQLYRGKQYFSEDL